MDGQVDILIYDFGGLQDFQPPIHLTDSDFAVITQVMGSIAGIIDRGPGRGGRGLEVNSH